MRKYLASEEMWETFNVWVVYFPVWLVGKCGKILNLARYWKIEIKLLNEILSLTLLTCLVKGRKDVFFFFSRNKCVVDMPTPYARNVSTSSPPYTHSQYLYKFLCIHMYVHPQGQSDKHPQKHTLMQGAQRKLFQN